LLLRLLQWPLRALARPIVRRVPRDAALAVFGSASERFADNPAYAFIGCAGQPGVRCVWISGSRATVDHLRRAGFEAHLRWSRRGMWAAVRARWFVHGWHLSDINLWLADGATTFNLWHGVGVKRIQRARVGEGAAVYNAPDGSLTARIFADDRHVPDLVLSTSPSMTPVLAHAFGVPPERCLELGYPRNDHLVAGTPPPPALVDAHLYERLADRHVVGYFPTFRDDSMSIPGGAPVITEVADIVGAQGSVLLFKAHDASRVDVDGRDSLVVIPHDADLNAYLGLCDVLVTDYSSVASDFLLLSRPIVLFVPDLDDYAAGRGFALDPTTHLPGVVTRTAAELYGALARVRDLPLPANQDELREFYWGHAPGGASTRLRQVLTSGRSKSTG
jgi:CDP-glycerol glycerophosphotransferase (TagB/SpsB family)